MAGYAQIMIAVSLFLVNAVLALLLSRIYLQDRKRISYLAWSSGLRLFAIATIISIMFAAGLESSFLASIYRFAVMVPIAAFAVGFVQFSRSMRLKRPYYYAMSAMAIALLYFELYPLGMMAAAVAVVLSAVALLSIISVSARAFLKDRNPKVLAAIPGALAFVAVGMMPYSASPFYYFSEILAVSLLWLGFAGMCGAKEYGAGI